MSTPAATDFGQRRLKECSTLPGMALRDPAAGVDAILRHIDTETDSVSIEATLYYPAGSRSANPLTDNLAGERSEHRHPSTPPTRDMQARNHFGFPDIDALTTGTPPHPSPNLHPLNIIKAVAPGRVIR